MNISIGNLSVRCLQSDVDNQSDVEALFYYVNFEEKVVSHPVDQELDDLREGQALLRQVQPDRFFIYARPPSATDENLLKEVLKCCFKNAFELCERHGIASMALPLTSGIGTHCPVSTAAAAATEAVVEKAKDEGSLRTIRFAVSSASEFNTLPRYLIRGAASLEAA